jgi:hypothetical protein
VFAFEQLFVKPTDLVPSCGGGLLACLVLRRGVARQLLQERPVGVLRDESGPSGLGCLGMGRGALGRWVGLRGRWPRLLIVTRVPRRSFVLGFVYDGVGVVDFKISTGFF